MNSENQLARQITLLWIYNKAAIKRRTTKALIPMDTAEESQILIDWDVTPAAETSTQTPVPSWVAHWAPEPGSAYRRRGLPIVVLSVVNQYSSLLTSP